MARQLPKRTNIDRMGLQLDIQGLQTAFDGRPDLIGAIQQAAGAPEWIELFNEITKHVCSLREAAATSEPAMKKRKLESSVELPINEAPPTGRSNGASKANGNGTIVAKDEAESENEEALLQIKDISFVLPQRKKYTIEFTAARVRARHPESKELIAGISYAWKDIAYAFCLPVPEKAQKQNNYILFPKSSNLPGQNIEPLVFTIPATAPKPGAITGKEAVNTLPFSDTHKAVFDWIIGNALKAAGNNVVVVEANEKQFASVQKEAHRPNEKAVFIKGFRGSKDGYLFFLNTGILWGFKKPLLFLPKEQISAVSYTNVLQRTFNLNIEVYLANDGSKPSDGPDAEEEKEEFEFAMLDQENFGNIDTYIKRHGLQDSSMAEQRKAKRLGVNVVKGENGEVIDEGDATGELEKALQDEEDEEEEDYDPGSEGESEGSGSSDEEEDDLNEGDDGGVPDDEDDEAELEEEEMEDMQEEL